MGVGIGDFSIGDDAIGSGWPAPNYTRYGAIKPKRAGVGFPTYRGSVSAITAESTSGAYVASNALDLVRVTNPWRASSTGYTYLWLNFAAPVPAQLISVIGHNVTTAGTIRVRLYAGVTTSFASAALYDSGTMPMWPGKAAPVSGLRAVRPVLLSKPVTIQSAVIEINTNLPVAATVEAVDISGWWSWGGISPGKQTGFDARTPVTRLAGGVDDVPQTWLARTASGQIDLMDAAVTQSTGLDFLRLNDLNVPFVFSPDIENAESWARTCMLVRNQKMNPYVGALYRRDRVAFNFIEHQR